MHAVAFVWLVLVTLIAGLALGLSIVAVRRSAQRGSPQGPYGNDRPGPVFPEGFPTTPPSPFGPPRQFGPPPQWPVPPYQDTTTGKPTAENQAPDMRWQQRPDEGPDWRGQPVD